MPENDPLASPAGVIHLDQVVFNELLAQVVMAASKSAEGATASASANQAVRDELAELKAALNENTKAVTRMNELRESEQARLQQAREDEQLRLDQKNKWLRSLLTPKTLYYTLIIIAAAFGFRVSLLDWDAPAILDQLPVVEDVRSP